MNTKRLLNVLLISLVMSLSQAAVQAEEKDRQEKAPDSKPVAQEKKAGDSASGKQPLVRPVYVPPMRGAPVARVGGGTRGIGDDLPYVSVVTPEHTGYTSSSQPVLYWYLSEPVDTRFEFALINDDEIEPIIEITSDREMQEGLNFLDLSEHGVSLKPGIIYQWSVALVGQLEKRSSDIVSSGTIEFVELTEAQSTALGKAGANEAVVIFAREGYWYDAFTGLSQLIDDNPGDAGLLGMRTALLRQVGLDQVAEAGQ